MLNINSPTLDKVIGDIVEEVLRERAKEARGERAEEENQDTALEVMPNEKEVVVEEGESGPSTPTREQKSSICIWPRRASWKKEVSSNWFRHLRKKSSDKVGRS